MTRKEDWIQIYKPDNTEKIASPDYIRSLLRIDVDKRILENQIRDLTYRIEELEAPIRKAKVLDLLKGDPQSVHTLAWFRARSWPSIQERDLKALVLEGILRSQVSGNKRIVYGLRESVEE